MNRHEAGKITIEYVKKIFGFALSRMTNITKAEDLASRITMEVYSAFLKEENIKNVDGYIYRIAQNVYARLIDENSRFVNLSIDEMDMPADSNFTDNIIKHEDYKAIRREVTYLSKTQREIVIMHYYDRLKLKEIAEKINLPLGTVKWHLYEAKNNMKEGFNKMRTVGNLGLQPISLTSMGHSGKPGKMGDTNDFLKKRLTQNVAYAAYHMPKTINQIAEELGVSPLFIEDEVSYLEEYGFIDKVEENKYLTNIYISEPTKEIREREHALYSKCAKVVCDKYVPLLFDAMASYNIKEIYVPGNDANFLMWSIITYACDYKLSINNSYNTDGFSVKRKDGGDYIAMASLKKDFKVDYDESRYNSCGNMTRGSSKYSIISWQLDTYYDDRKGGWSNNLYSDFEYLYEFISGTLIKEQNQIEKFQRLYEKGYISDVDGKDIVNIILVKDDSFDYIPNNSLTKKLPGITEELKAVSYEFDQKMFELRSKSYPQHMQKLCKAWCSNCLSHNGTRTRVLEQLLMSGKLKLPSNKQKSGLNTLMFSDILPGAV